MPPSSLANIDTRSQSSLKSTSFSVLNDGKDAGQPGSFLGSLAGGGPPGNRASTSSLTTTAASSGFSSGTVTGRLISATQSPSLPSLASLSSSSSTPTSLRVSQLSNAAIFKQRSYSSLLVDDDLNFEPIDEAELTALLRQVGRRPSVPNLVWQAAMANASKQHLGSSVAVTAAGSEASPLSPSAFASWPATSEMFSKPRSINSRSRSFGTQSVLSPLGTALATGPASGHPLASARMLERRPSLPFLSPAAQPFLPPSNLSSASSSSSIPVSSESAVQQSPPLLTTNSPPAAPTVVPSIAVAQASQQSLPAQSSQSLPAQPSQSPVPSAAGGRPAVTAGGVAPSLAVASLVKRNNVRQRSHSSGSSIPYTPSPLSSSAITPTATATASSPAPIAGPTSTSSSLPTASIPSEVTSSASKSASVNAVDVALDAPAFAAVRQAAAVPPTRTLSAPTMTALLPPVSNNAAVAMAVAASIALDREAAEAAEEENDDFGDTLTPSAPMHRTHVRTSSLAEQSGEDDDEELEEVLTPLVSAKSMRSQSMSIVPTPRETLQALQMHQSFDSLVISPSPSFPSFLGSSSRSSSSDSLMMRSLNNLNSSANDLTTVQATSPLVGATSLLGGSSTPVYPAPSSPYVARRTIREGWPVPTSSLRRDSHSFDSLSSHLSPNSSCSQLPLASSSSSSFSAYSSGASASQYNSDRYSSTGSDLERFEAVPLRFIFDRVFPAWVTEAPLGLDSSDSTAGASASNAGGLGGAIAFPPGSYSAPFVPADGGAGEMEIRPQDVLAGRYQVVELLDSAVFSRAYHCVDLTSGTPVCVKVLKKSSDAFSQGVEEVRLLKYLNAGVDVDAVHIVKLSDYFVYRGHLLVVCELLRHNLYQQMKLTRNAADPYFTLARLKQIAKQMLTALAFAHARGVIHADLKPENILLRSRSQAQVKLIDFGSSLFSPYASASDDPNKPSGSANLFPGVTDVNLNKQHYIQSRPYRAPEVILGLPFDGRIDVWSLGCVLAELFMGRVLFRSDSIATLLARIIACRGNIPSDMLQFGSAVSSYFVVRDGVPFLFDRRREKQSVPASPSKLLQASSAATATAVAAGGSGGMTTTTAAAAGGGGLLSPSSPHSPTAPAYLVRAVSRRLGDILQESGVHPNDQDDFSLFVDFLSTLLMIDPRQRPTARVAMRHAWFA
ncbi:protein kinase [Capsaspora owczarzaki ATCC 30864]|nr:protein kinase [Capsaspora owczarzaki ATCC 30864]|eukprot:XP_004347931.1 protein kinase [Capsaspora owczarzaki ATCC 30864]